MILYIKNMVCDRCKMAVTTALEKLGLHPEKVALGEVQLKEGQLTEIQQQRLATALHELGFERIEDRKARMIERIKNKVIHVIHHSEQVSQKYNWSDILAEELHYDYNYLSNLFSSVEGLTIEQFIIRQKIERVKELLFYDELSLSEISLRLGYSSVAHLSSQFKKITGMTPSQMKKSRQIEGSRRSLDDI